MKSLVRILIVAGLLAVGLALGAATYAAPIAPFTDAVPVAPASIPALQGCSGTPTISWFAANPPVIAPGQISTLSWGLVGNASAAYLVSPGGTQGIGTPGSQQVNPTQTTTYILTAWCGGNNAQVPVTVTVQSSGGCQGAPILGGFSANPTTIRAGQTSNLSWGLVSNADAVQLSSPSGTSGVASPGNIGVSPNQTTTYTLTGWCKGTPVSQSVTVNVSNPPPPPPSSSSQITGMNRNGALSNRNQLVVTVNYFWNGQDAPAVLQGTAYNSGGQQIGQSNATRIDAQRNFYANLLFRNVNPGNVASVNVCMIGSSGNHLVCQGGNP
jgi:hypothetical protein